MEAVSQIDRDSNVEFLERKFHSFKGPVKYTRVVSGIKVLAIISGWFKIKNTHYHSDLGPYFVSKVLSTDT